MYGIVNKAIQDLLTQQFGEETWEKVKVKSGIDVDYFISNEPYNDDITFKLTVAAADVVNIPIGEILIAFGEFWILDTAKLKYGYLMDSGGPNLKDFLINLPNFHNRIMLIYPKLTPPEFQVSHVTDNSLYLHYFSKREGLQEFVRGLLQGLGKFFNTPVEIDLIQSRNEGSSHEIFNVSW